MDETPIVRASGLTKRYRGASEPAVDDLALSVCAGDIFGLLGPNGAGKSTTIMMLCGLLRPDAGRIEVFGQDIGRRGTEIRRQIGVAPQEIALFPALTAEENLTYFGRMYDLPGKVIRERVRDLLAAFGLAEKAHARVAQFSGGMKRRLNLMAALLHRPRLLILDEPTSGVDVQSRRMILDHLQALRAEGTTIIYSSHLLEEAEAICTRFTIIDRGRLLCRGALHDLLAQDDCPTLEALFLKLTGREIRN